MNTSPMFGLWGLGAFELALITAAMAFWVWMLADCANHERQGTVRITWLLAIIFVGVVGAPLYFLIRKLPRRA